MFTQYENNKQQQQEEKKNKKNNIKQNQRTYDNHTHRQLNAIKEEN